MIELGRIYDYMFWPLETSESNFVEGTDRHIALLEAHNPGGIYNSIIATTKTDRDNMKAAISARDSEDSEQIGSTLLVNITQTDFIKFVRIREGLIKSTFEGEETPAYLEFFPHGLTEYDKPTLAETETLMDRMVAKATKYEADLGTPFKNACIAKRTAFVNARTAQVTNIGQASDLYIAVQTALFNVAVQLQVNLFTTAINHIGESVNADVYFDQRYFIRPDQSGLYTGENATGQTKTVRSAGWAANKIVKVTNQGTNTFTIGFMNADAVPVSGGQTIAVGASSEFTAATLGYNVTMHFLNITAPAGSGAKWKVEVSG